MDDRLRLAAVMTLLFLICFTAATGPVAAAHDATDCSFPITETDATGTEVTLTEPATEVVVLDASSAQVFWELGAEDHISGMPVEDFTAYLDGSENRTDVTDGQQVNVERVVELDPDLVIAPNYVGEETVAQLRETGLTVYQLGLENSIQSIYDKTALYGHFVGGCAAATETVNTTQTEIEEIETSVADLDRPRVLYYFFNFAAGSETFIHELLETAGGTNVAAEAGTSGYVEISDEVFVEEDPEWIVAPSHAGLPDGEPFTSTTAFRSEQTLVVNENLVSQAGPRIVVPLRQMAEAFHPEAFDANGEPTTPDSEPSPEPAEQPGFGIPIAVISLLVATTFWLHRRTDL
ncbi:ABC transporter substrate-binding protein [Natronomonas sp. F2-12]|uniref:ABC transporter substrate-binding protein n=1 Tax=Natronomonas aquatica TaxID=2841590 RepID=A0A9R1D6E7_9EURY|nr:PGF-CTERM-anchored ABC transporter substrate-binding protein [Natronomonas aquatica]MCQ4334211.1 ABC transporter substrate-binding protein [Natronomonas aquatica]